MQAPPQASVQASTPESVQESVQESTPTSGWSMEARCIEARHIEHCFDGLFLAAAHTTLRGGAAEPVYLPAQGTQPAQILYREDYLASALHEVAHWCVAGAARRQLQDYGYWYAEAGRDAQAQNAFEQVEVRPQAIEGLFARALGVPFRVSLDNPGRPDCDPERFAAAVHAQMMHLERSGLPPRAARFRAALAALAARRQTATARRC